MANKSKLRTSAKFKRRKKPFSLYLKISFWSLLVVMIARGFMRRFFTQDADSAYYFSLLNPNYRRSSIDREFNTSFFDLVNLVQSSLSEKENLISFGTTQSVPVYENHLYSLSYMVNFINGPLLQNAYFPFLLMSLSVVFGLYVLFSYLVEQRKIGYRWSLFFLFLVVSSPTFFYGMYGQLYMDRLAFGPMIYVLIRILETTKRENKLIKIVFASLTAYTISERVAFSLGIAILVAVMRSKNFAKRDQVKIALLGVFGLLIYFYWSNVLSKSFYGSSTDFKTMLNNFTSVINGPRTMGFATLIVVLLPLLILSISTKRGFLLASFAIMPNLLVTVGGAELTGFLTHYHSLYLPVIVSTAAFGLRTLLDRKHPFSRPVALGSVFVLTCLSTLSVSSAYKQDQVSYFKSLTISGGKIAEVFGFVTSERFLTQKNAKEFGLQFPLYVGKNNVVTPAELMPALAFKGVQNMTFFPIGLGQEKFVIVSYLSQDLQSPYVDAFGLIPPTVIQEWAPIQQKILNTQYREVFRSETSQRTYIAYELVD